MGRGRGHGGSPGLPAQPRLSPLFCWEEKSLHPRGVLVWDPQPSPEGLVVQPGGSRGDDAFGLQVALCAVCQHRGPSALSSCPLCPCPLPGALHMPRAPRIPALCRQLVPRGSPVTLEHKQLCSSSPVNYIMSNEQDQAEGIKP